MYKSFVKRILGLLLSIIGLPFFVVIFIVVAPLIVIEDRGPIFYNAPRLGRNGKTYKMYKFRSMKVNAPDLRNEDGTTYNSEDDPRVTKIGKFLRKTSLDETPQLLNVLIGNMAFIGPRPDLPGADKTAYRPGDEVKLTVNPGITGYSQAYYRNSSTLDQRFNGAVYYAN
nr:sugar transferase [Lachnospiraceae bacterium]